MAGNDLAYYMANQDEFNKLTEDQVLEIRERHSSYASMAKQFKVSLGLIHHIVKRTTWKHI